MTVVSTPLVPSHRFSVEGDKRLLTLELPSLESLTGVDLDIGTAELRLLLPGSCEHVRIPLPVELPADAGVPTAKFSRKRGELTVIWEAVAAVTRADSKVAVTGSCNTLVENPLPETSTVPRAAKEDEETECLEELEEEITHVLKQCTVSKLKSIAPLGGASVLLGDFAVVGETGINKRRCRFRVSVSFTWEVLDAFGGFLGARGSGKISDFTEEQALPDVTIRMSTSGNAQAKAAGEWMRRQGAVLISECLNGADICEAVLSDWEEAASDAAPETAAPLDQEALTQWAQDWFDQHLANLTVKLFGGSASAAFANPRVSGEVAMLSQNGALAAVFQLRVECAWTIATATGQAEGTLLVAEFKSGHAPDDHTIHVEAAPGKKTSGQLLTAFRQTGVSAVRGLLARFVNELEVRTKS